MDSSKNRSEHGGRQKTIVRHWKTAERQSVQFVNKGWGKPDGLFKSIEKDTKVLETIMNVLTEENMKPLAPKSGTDEDKSNNNDKVPEDVNQRNISDSLSSPEVDLPFVDKSFIGFEMQFEPSKLDGVFLNEYVNANRCKKAGSKDLQRARRRMKSAATASLVTGILITGLLLTIVGTTYMFSTVEVGTL